MVLGQNIMKKMKRFNFILVMTSDGSGLASTRHSRWGEQITLVLTLGVCSSIMPIDSEELVSDVSCREV